MGDQSNFLVCKFLPSGYKTQAQTGSIFQLNLSRLYSFSIEGHKHMLTFFPPTSPKSRLIYTLLTVQSMQ